MAPEQRGYSSGARPDMIEDYSIDLLVADVIGMADALGASTFHLVGHDWGAIVAWHVAAAHPERLKTLTIVSVPHPSAWAAAFADPSSDQPQRSAYLPEMKRLGSEENMGEEFLRFAFDNSGLAGFDTEPHIAVLGSREAMRAALNWYRAYDFTTMGFPTSPCRLCSSGHRRTWRSHAKEPNSRLATSTPPIGSKSSTISAIGYPNWPPRNSPPCSSSTSPPTRPSRPPGEAARSGHRRADRRAVADRGTR